MPVNITDDSTFTDPIVAPADSDPADRTYVLTIAQGLANRTRHLFERFDALTGIVVLPGPVNAEKYLGLPNAQAISGWTITNPREWVSNANGAKMVWDIAPYLPRNTPGVTLSQVAVLLKPGAARAPGGSYTIGDTMQCNLTRIAHGFTVGTPSRTILSVDDSEDDGTSNLQWVELTPGGMTSVQGMSIQVSVTSSIADSDSIPDKVYALYVKYSVTRMGT